MATQPDDTLDGPEQWIGRSESRTDLLAAGPEVLLAALLDRHCDSMQAGDALSPLAHWLYFLPACRQSQLGQDGHPSGVGLLPAIRGCRRMWAASEVDYLRPLRLGEAVRRDTRIVDVTRKEGRSGPLLFVSLAHTISGQEGKVAISETQQLVYRDLKGTHEPARRPREAPAEREWCRRISPDATLLFRYSALTFNAHRIHYDRRYAAEVEGHPGLVVQGPLIATMLVDQLLRECPGAKLRRFEFRALHPVYDDAPFLLCGQPQPDGRTIRLWCQSVDGALCTDALATIA